jgi:integrase/recombinase XerD
LTFSKETLTLKLKGTDKVCTGLSSKTGEYPAQKLGLKEFLGSERTPTVFKTSCVLRARIAGFDSQAVLPKAYSHKGFTVTDPLIETVIYTYYTHVFFVIYTRIRRGSNSEYVRTNALNFTKKGGVFIMSIKQKNVRKGRRIVSAPKVNFYLMLVEMFERFLVAKRAEALAARTLNDYETHFGYFYEFLEGDMKAEDISVDLLREYVAYMINDRGLKPMTVNLRVRTSRAFMRFCYNESYIDPPVHESIKAVKAPEDRIQALTPSEMKVLLSVIDETFYAGYRDKVMVYALLDTMVRISELLAVKRGNVDLKAGSIQLEAIDTKTRKARIVPLSSQTIKLLAQYMVETSDFNSKFLFLTNDGRQMSANTFRRNMQEYLVKALIRNKRVSPHSLRHTGALLYIMNDGDPFSLQKILGHTDMSMVRKYIQMTESDVKRQHNTFSPLNRLK